MRPCAHCTVVPASPTPRDVREYLSTKLLRRGCAFQTLERRLRSRRRGVGYEEKGELCAQRDAEGGGFLISFVVAEAGAEAGFLCNVHISPRE